MVRHPVVAALRAPVRHPEMHHGSCATWGNVFDWLSLFEVKRVYDVRIESSIYIYKNIIQSKESQKYHYNIVMYIYICVCVCNPWNQREP